MVVGAPRLTLTYQGTVATGTRPTRVFAQLVDPTTGLVLGNQVTPVDVNLDGRTHTLTVPLEMVVFAGRPHATVELQLVATTVAFAQPRLGGAVHFARIAVSLPVAAGVAPEVHRPAVAGRPHLADARRPALTANTPRPCPRCGGPPHRGSGPFSGAPGAGGGGPTSGRR